MKLNTKGFTYVVIVVIIISFITALFLLFRPEPVMEYTSNKLSENYKNELKYLVDSNITAITLDNFNSKAYDFIRAHNYEVSICTIISEGDNIYVSNYTGQTDKNIQNQITVLVTKALNPNNISLGNCSVDINSDIKTSYYIEIRETDMNYISYIRGSNPNESDINRT